MSRYIAKYIAKPKDWIPWLEQGLCESPRRLASRGFGLSGIPIEDLKRYYQGLDLDLSLNDFLDRICERKKNITLNGTKFPLPRRIKQELFYNRYTQVNLLPDGKKEYKVKFSHTQLQTMALAYARNRNIEDFSKQLRFDQASFNESFDRSRIDKVLQAERSCIEDRETFASKSLSKQLRSDSR